MHPKHLAIVRAALTFWDEEMASASRGTYRHYLHSTDQDVVISAADIAMVRAYFNQVAPKFGLIEVQSGELVSKLLVDDIRELNREPSQQIVSVLVR